MDDELDASGWRCALPGAAPRTVQMGHGSGGRMMSELISTLFQRHFSNPFLDALDDGATLPAPAGRLVYSTDSYVVDPLFFPGGNIGDLAVNGTINDLCMCGATPLYLSAGFIIEEGFPLDELEQIVHSMAEAARGANTLIVSGDTKVVDKGKADRLFINTSGIGVLSIQHAMGSHHLRRGDAILLSGPIGDHGMAVLSQRQDLGFSSTLRSDTAALHEMSAALLRACGEAVHALRDPTRGGLAAVLNEFARASHVAIELQEAAIPVRPQVAAACDVLGLDPLYIANEGKMGVVVAAERAQAALDVLRGDPLGAAAERIGEVCAGNPGQVSMHTPLGGWRIIDQPYSDPLPRIC